MLRKRYFIKEVRLHYVFEDKMAVFIENLLKKPFGKCKIDLESQMNLSVFLHCLNSNKTTTGRNPDL